MRHAIPAVLAIALSACGLAASAGLTTSTTSSTSSTSSTSAAPSNGAVPSGAPAGPDKAWDHPGMLVRGQLLPLVGMTVDAARERLKQLGFDGQIVVSENYQYIDKCGQNKVCGVEPEAGTGVHDELRLVINKKLEIAAPPP